jgi:hypothetical protein
MRNLILTFKIKFFLLSHLNLNDDENDNIIIKKKFLCHFASQIYFDSEKVQIHQNY